MIPSREWVHGYGGNGGGGGNPMLSPFLPRTPAPNILDWSAWLAMARRPFSDFQGGGFPTGMPRFPMAPAQQPSGQQSRQPPNLMFSPMGFFPFQRPPPQSPAESPPQPGSLASSDESSSKGSAKKKKHSFSVDNLLVNRMALRSSGETSASYDSRPDPLCEKIELDMSEAGKSTKFTIRALLDDAKHSSSSSSTQDKGAKVEEPESGEERKAEQSSEEGLVILRVKVGELLFGGLFCRPGNKFTTGHDIHLQGTSPYYASLRSTLDPKVGNLEEIAAATQDTESGIKFRTTKDVESGEELLSLTIADPKPVPTPLGIQVPDPETQSSPTSTIQCPSFPTDVDGPNDGEVEFGNKNANGYQCERCGKVFTYRYYRDKHLKYTRCVDKGDRKFPCHLCSRSFEKRDRLRIHILHVHEKHRPHCCGVCGKRFSQSSSLNKHLRVHSGERPYKCVYCGKAFTASSILRTHIRQHSGEKPFKCKYCGKAFASHAAHDSHVRRTHTSPKGESHACAWCGKSFQHSSHLKFHLQCIHGGWGIPGAVPDSGVANPADKEVKVPAE